MNHWNEDEIRNNESISTRNIGLNRSVGMKVWGEYHKVRDYKCKIRYNSQHSYENK